MRRLDRRNYFLKYISELSHRNNAEDIFLENHADMSEKNPLFNFFKNRQNEFWQAFLNTQIFMRKVRAKLRHDFVARCGDIILTFLLT